MIHSHKTNSPFYTQPLVGVYAHGELETFLEAEDVVTSGLETYCKYNLVESRAVPYSIHDTFAINRMGEVKKVRCYLWYGKQTKVMRGLIIFVDDTEELKYAEKLCMLGADSL